MRSGHTSKGHQSSDGKVLAAGDYLSRFTVDKTKAICDKVFCCLTELLKELAVRVNDTGNNEEQVAAEIHKKMILANLYSHAKHTDVEGKVATVLISHTTCYCCLFGQAEHFLPCGHVLCSACVRTYGHPIGFNVIEVSECPIEGDGNRRYSSWKIHLKPKQAGVRILSLDG